MFLSFWWLLSGWANLLPLVSRVGCSQISTVPIVLLSHWVGFEENPSKTNGKPNLTATIRSRQKCISPPKDAGVLVSPFDLSPQKWLVMNPTTLVTSHPSIIVNHNKSTFCWLSYIISYEIVFSATYIIAVKSVSQYLQVSIPPRIPMIF